jgi:flavorubredoxin
MFTIPDPLRVADGTYLVRPLVERFATSDDVPHSTVVPGERRALHVNSMIITGAEPVLVDTGAAALREQWVEQTFCLVDPDDVRWIFLSHAEADHIGNLDVALEMCPHATLVTSWLPDERNDVALDVPAERRRHIVHGEELRLPDRSLVAVRPPVFDLPSTLGLHDTSTGVYWSADAFGAPVPRVVDEIDDLPRATWLAAFDAYTAQLSPWTEIVDAVQFGRWIDEVAALEPTAIASAHGPLLVGESIDIAIEQLRHVPCRSHCAPRHHTEGHHTEGHHTEGHHTGGHHIGASAVQPAR